VGVWVHGSWPATARITSNRQYLSLTILLSPSELCLTHSLYLHSRCSKLYNLDWFLQIGPRADGQARLLTFCCLLLLRLCPILCSHDLCSLTKSMNGQALLAGNMHHVMIAPSQKTWQACSDWAKGSKCFRFIRHRNNLWSRHEVSEEQLV
jgi:hypothetical protein